MDRDDEKIVIYHPRRDPDGAPPLNSVPPHFIAQGRYYKHLKKENMTATLVRGGTVIKKGTITRAVGHPRWRWNAEFEDVDPGRYELWVRDSTRPTAAASVIVVVRPHHFTDPEIYFPLNGETAPPHPTVYGSSGMHDTIWVRLTDNDSINYPQTPAEATVSDGFWSTNVDNVPETGGNNTPLYNCHADPDYAFGSPTTTTGIKVGGMMGITGANREPEPAE